MPYLKRNLATKITTLLQHFPVVAIIGARQTGKTTLAKQVGHNWHYFDLEDGATFDFISSDPKFFFTQYPKNLIIDEAQEYPDIFKTLRGVIDAARTEKGRFILTGSSNPELLKHISESLAGRIALVELGTLKTNEILQKPLSKFYKIFEDKLSRDTLPNGPPPIANYHMQQTWLKGGYPEPILSDNELFYAQWMENYRSTYINRDIAKLFPKLNRYTYRRFITLLGKLTGTIINKSEIARALEISDKTVKEYLTIAEGTFIWRNLPSFDRTEKSIIKMPKGQLRDSGLLHNFLNINNMDKLYTDPCIGKSFEAFVIEELIKGLDATLITNYTTYYYRTRAGAEIDLILDGPFGILPIEIKYGSSIKQRQITTLTQFVKEHNLPFGLVINQGESTQWLNEHIIQLPVGWL